MEILKFEKPSFFLLGLMSAALLWAMVPSTVSAKTFHIKVTDEGFDPDNITIEVGDTVKWIVKSGIAHTMQPGDDQGGTCDEDLNHTFMSNNETFSHTFNTPKTCHYTCPLHGAGMNGVVNVKPKGDGSTTPTTIKP